MTSDTRAEVGKVYRLAAIFPDWRNRPDHRRMLARMIRDRRRADFRDEVPPFGTRQEAEDENAEKIS